MERKPWVAGLLNFLCWGLGNFYCGRALRGIVINIFLSGIFLLLCRIVLVPIPKLNIFLFSLMVLTAYGFVIFDGVRTARKASTEKFYQRWYFYIVFLAVAQFGVQSNLTDITKKYSLQAYRIPSVSLEPTFFIGDHLIADKYMFPKTPLRGAIVIFPFPLDESKDFIKRIVGLPGETLEIKKQHVFINNTPLDEPYVKHTEPISEEPLMPRDDLEPVSIPQGKVFLMGDNRENSHDSRFWGLLDADKISGEAKMIYWSWDSEEGRVRWERIGMVID